MCNPAVLEFGRARLVPELVAGRDVLEVGSHDVNGSLRSRVTGFGCARYVGIDLRPGDGVDIAMDARHMVDRFGPTSFDIVLSTEMVEHVRDWRTIIQQMKAVLRPGGHLLLTTRSKGFPYHGWPSDFWRFEPDDIAAMFEDMEVLALVSDPSAPGVFVFARRPMDWTDSTPSLALWSIVTGRRQSSISRSDLARFRLRSRLARLAKPLRSGWSKVRGVTRHGAQETAQPS